MVKVMILEKNVHTIFLHLLFNFILSPYIVILKVTFIFLERMLHFEMHRNYYAIVIEMLL